MRPLLQVADSLESVSCISGSVCVSSRRLVHTLIWLAWPLDETKKKKILKRIPGTGIFQGRIVRLRCRSAVAALCKFFISVQDIRMDF
jgi:hypothetical protein